MTNITSTLLADGRELIYFDDAGSARPLRAIPRDRRDLPARAEPGELRFDALTGEWVAVAAHRQTAHPPAAGGPVPALPHHAGQPHRDPGAGLRRRRV